MNTSVTLSISVVTTDRVDRLQCDRLLHLDLVEHGAHRRGRTVILAHGCLQVTKRCSGVVWRRGEPRRHPGHRVQGVALPGDQRGPHEQERRERGLGKGATGAVPNCRGPETYRT